MTPWTVTHQAPLSMEFPRREYRSGYPFSPGDLPNPGIKPGTLALQAVSLLSEPPVKPLGAVSPIVRIHESRNQGLETEVSPFTIMPSDPPAKCLLPVPVTLCSASLGVLVPKQGILPLGNTLMISLNWKLMLVPEYFGFPLPLN